LVPGAVSFAVAGGVGLGVDDPAAAVELAAGAADAATTLELDAVGALELVADPLLPPHPASPHAATASAIVIRALTCNPEPVVGSPFVIAAPVFEVCLAVWTLGLSRRRPSHRRRSRAVTSLIASSPAAARRRSYAYGRAKVNREPPTPPSTAADGA
jgi:hypothetical protein